MTDARGARPWHHPWSARVRSCLDVADYHDGWLTGSKARKGDRLASPIRSTKTGKVKRLPVPLPLQKWIEKHVALDARLRAEPLFTVSWSGRGIRPRGRWSGTSLRRTWIQACEQVGVKVSLYAGTRHAFATDCPARGVSERALQTFLGHADTPSRIRLGPVQRHRYTAEAAPAVPGDRR